jgi:hypothetical protein
MQTDQQEPGRLFAKDPARANKERAYGLLFALVGATVTYSGSQRDNIYLTVMGLFLMLIALICWSVADHRLYGPAPWFLSRRAGEDLLVWPAVGLRWVYRHISKKQSPDL